MKKLVYGLLVLANMIAAPMAFAAASPSIVGSWRITFYSEPSRLTGATQCVVFKLVPGTVAGVPTSGTWTSPSFPGWFGQWIQLGDHVRWFGISGGVLSTVESGNIAHANVFGGVSFNHFWHSTGATSSAGSWRGLRTTSCSTEVPKGHVGGDPAAIAG